MTSIGRRQFLATGVTAVGSMAGASRRIAAYTVDGPLGFMLHALRASVITDLPGTLAKVAALGYQEVELISFRGFAGPGTRDGFSPLAPLRAPAIRAMIRDAGLSVRSAHFKYAELDDERIDHSLDWAHDLGLGYVTVADVGPASTMDDWKTHFDRLNRLGERLSGAGLQLGVHTPNEMWRRLDGVLVADAFLHAVDARRCSIQLELSTAQNNGIDNAEFLSRALGRVFAVHLRDAKTPAAPLPYLAAVPLGQGDLDWKRVFTAAKTAGVKLYIVEMQTQGAMDPIEALRVSADYIRRLVV
jgi:sugar phosphate isomerase/epimerase